MKKNLSVAFTLKFLNASQTLLSNNTFFHSVNSLNMHSKAKMEVSILYNIKYLQHHGSLFSGVCAIRN